MMTIDPTPATPPPAFRWGPFIGGILLALFFGGIANIFSGLIGMSTGAKLLAALVGAIPGGVFVLLSLPASKNGFAQGLLIGGCIIGLLGGVCGAQMVGTSFH
jgi:hypothetical protein